MPHPPDRANTGHARRSDGMVSSRPPQRGFADAAPLPPSPAASSTDQAGSAMSRSPGGERVVLYPRRRHAVELLALQATVVLLLALASMVFAGSGPLDYSSVPLAASVLGFLGVVLVLLFLLRLVLAGKTPVALTPHGIESGQRRVPWSQIVSVRTVWRPGGRHVRLTRRDALTARLYAPWGSAWLPDPRFQDEMAWLRAWADRYGPGIQHRTQNRRAPAIAVVSLVVALVAAAGVRAAQRGVIWASTPTASRVTAACPALQAAGLDRIWPADSRIRSRDDQDHNDLGDYSYCWWENRTDRTPDAPYLRLTAVVKRHGAYGRSSPIAMAIDSYDSDRAEVPSAEPVAGLGDEAFTYSAHDRVQVTARRANVTVTIGIDLDSPQPQSATATARSLTAAILADARLDATRRR